MEFQLPSAIGSWSSGSLGLRETNLDFEQKSSARNSNKLTISMCDELANKREIGQRATNGNREASAETARALYPKRNAPKVGAGVDDDEDDDSGDTAAVELLRG